MAEYPWAIILDGLDEVPASSNRIAVLDAVQDLVVDISTRNADVLILATTRPQGYTDDFSDKIYRHLTLAPLSSTRAIHYSHRLVKARWGADIDRVEKTMVGLNQAVE